MFENLTDYLQRSKRPKINDPLLRERLIKEIPDINEYEFASHLFLQEGEIYLFVRASEKPFDTDLPDIFFARYICSYSKRNEKGRLFVNHRLQGWHGEMSIAPSAFQAYRKLQKKK